MARNSTDPATPGDTVSENTVSEKEVVVVGAGITGLVAAFYLERLWNVRDIALLEAAERAGGNIATEREDGFTVERGPNGFLDNVPETLRLLEDLGLEPQRSCDAARKRFLACRGKLARVPEGPISFLLSPLLSLPGRLRVFCEPFARRRPPGDETVFNFAARRIGPEAAEVLVDAMVTGVFAGDSKVLSLKSAFPKMEAMERRYGSLVRALLAKMWLRLTGSVEAAPGGPAGPGGTLTSVKGGLENLIRALEKALEGRIVTGAPVSRIVPADRGFRVKTARGPFRARKVFLAVPAPRAAAILSDAVPAAADLLRRTPQAPVAVVACAFAREKFPHPLDGFGFLVPRREKSRLLGSLFTSSIFPDRSPPDKVLLRNMVGGLRDPLAVSLPDGKLTELVLGELRRYLGPLPDPERVWIFRHPEGISQYPPGHTARLNALELVLRRSGCLFTAGSSFRGISINLCVVQGLEAARRLARADCGRSPR